jgi:WD40 repeat protein
MTTFSVNPLAAAVVMALITPLAAWAQVTTYTYTIPGTGTRTISAGAFAADGSLIRTLTRAEARTAGVAHTEKWDQRDEAGKPIAPGTYTIKLVFHNIQYTWEGVIGNSSAEYRHMWYPGLHKALNPAMSFAMNPEVVHFSAGYNEAGPHFHGFSPDSPQMNAQSTHPSDLYRARDPFVAATNIATDGTRLYWSSGGGFSKASFVAAHELATGQQAFFSAGAPACLNYRSSSTDCYPDQDYQSVLDFRPDQDNPVTGLAVQRQGQVLALSYGATNTLRLVDKTSGKFIRDLSVPLVAGGVNQIAMSGDPAGDLWVISGNTVRRYTNISTTKQPVLSTVLSAGLMKPLAVAVDPRDPTRIWVADGGASQQLKRFNSVTGSLQQTIGVLGGPGNSGVISADRLCFALTATKEQAGLGVDFNGGLWATDTCNNRILGFTASGAAATAIATRPTSYLSTVDSGNPTRVFSNFMEYKVDYTKALGDGNNGAWTAVRNWLLQFRSLPASSRSFAEDPAHPAGDSGFHGFSTVRTLSNKRTYAVVSAYGSPYPGTQALYELTSTGAMRLSSTLPSPQAVTMPDDPATAAVEGQVYPNSRPELVANGDLVYSHTYNGRQTVLRLPLTGFDAQGNPVWGSTPVTVASAPTSSPTAPYFVKDIGGTRATFPITNTGKVIFFNASVGANTGYHLGAVNTGSNNWNWMASGSGPLDGKGTFQTRSTDPTVNYGGSYAMADISNVVYGYHGEFHTDALTGKIGQANQFMHYRDDGLFLGQFGAPTTRFDFDDMEASPEGVAGNSFSPTLVRTGHPVTGLTHYLYHNDESIWAGVHRWRLDGLQLVRELKSSFDTPRQGVSGSAIILR